MSNPVSDPTGYPFPPAPQPTPAAVPEQPIDPMDQGEENDGGEEDKGVS